MILFAQTSGNHSTNSGSWTPIPGLSLKLPDVVGEAVLLILNVPNPYATGTNFPAAISGSKSMAWSRAPLPPLPITNRRRDPSAAFQRRFAYRFS